MSSQRIAASPTTSAAAHRKTRTNKGQQSGYCTLARIDVNDRAEKRERLCCKETARLAKTIVRTPSLERFKETMVHHKLKALALLFAAVAFLHPSAAKSPDFRSIAAKSPDFRRVSWSLKPSRTNSDLSMRGGGFSLLGWTVPASHLAKFYVGFTGLNGAVMAVVPTIAASSYGSAFDNSKESLLATLLLERQGDAVLGTSLLLHLSTFTDMPFAQSVAWSTVPYVLSMLKGLATGQLTSLGFNPWVAIAMLLSILLPTLNIATPNGWNPKVATSILATILMLIGASGSLDPARSASMEGLDMAGGPGECHLGLMATSRCRVSHF